MNKYNKKRRKNKTEGVPFPRRKREDTKREEKSGIRKERIPSSVTPAGF